MYVPGPGGADDGVGVAGRGLNGPLPVGVAEAAGRLLCAGGDGDVAGLDPHAAAANTTVLEQMPRSQMR